MPKPNTNTNSEMYLYFEEIDITIYNHHSLSIFPFFFLFSADLSNQLILSKDATETEEGLKIRISFGTAFICIP